MIIRPDEKWVLEKTFAQMKSYNFFKIRPIEMQPKIWVWISLVDRYN